MRRFQTVVFFLCLSFSLAAQRVGTITGVVFDTSARQPLPNSTITVMQRKDSSLVSFTMTDKTGRFELSGIAIGEYRLLVTHVNYQSSSRLLNIDDEHKNIDVGNVIMNAFGKVLGEVVVSSEAPAVTITGDTIQYNAPSFKTQPNANVEDLLKKLPGVRVDRDGTVKAQGEKVQKVLVDGKEFFGDDPKIATKNLPADAIDKVQVFNKLSEQAQLTGFDDGNSEKTINLKLKKDRKKGMFGKINSGGGTDGRFDEKFNINSFKGARQMSAIGTGNNTNSEAFSLIDILSFTGAFQRLNNTGGNININVTPDDPLAGLLGANNTGINTSIGGGVNYNDIIGTKTDFRSNYFFTRYNPTRQSAVERQYFSPVNTYREKSYADNLSNTHRLNLSVDYQIDSFHSIKIIPMLNYQQTRNRTASLFSTSAENGREINEGQTNSNLDNNGYNFNLNALFRKKFRKKGRTFSINLLTSLNNTSGDGSVQSLASFYDEAGSFLRRDSINQQNSTEALLRGYNVRAVYTEPVFKRTLLEFSMVHGYTLNGSSKSTYDYDAGSGKFDVLNSSLTNNFRTTYVYDNAGWRFRRQAQRYSYAAGISLQRAELNGTTITGKDSAIVKSFTTVLPSARFQYDFSKFRYVLINYFTGTNPPSLKQLQPLADNTNPLYVILGNPSLKQEFTHTVRIHASLVSPYKNRHFFAFFTIQASRNKIVNFDRINSLGIDSVMPVNVNGVYNLNGNLSWGFPVHALKGSVEFSSDIGYYSGKQFLGNGSSLETNRIQTLSLGPDARLYMSPSETLNLSLAATISYSTSRYTIRPTGNSKYINQQYSVSGDWQLPARFSFATDFNYIINNQYAQGFRANVPLWNASISRQILHFNRGQVKLSVYDILDRNIAISRTTNQNFIEDTRVNGLRRFVLLSFMYSLARTGLTNEGGGVRTIMR